MVVSMRLNCTGAWTDYSDSVDVTAMKLNKSLNGENDPQKNQVAEIEVYASAYNFIRTNLIDSVNLYSNSICVKIVDTLCSNDEYNFKLETDSLKWCDNGECRMSFSMEEYNPLLDCIKQTVISDNANGLFQDNPVGGMIHPRFRYCDVFKPTFVFGMLLTFANSVDLLVASINLIIGSINLALAGINAILGTSFSIGSITYVGPQLIGCDRAFPAPYIRTYIDNVCDICGVTMDVTTNPILYDAVGYYYEACLLTAYTNKGVKVTSTQDYIVGNRPSWTLDAFLSKLKTFWNARWFIKGTEVYFERKDLIGQLLWGSTPAIDFTASLDKDQLIGNVCYEWNGEGKLRRLNMNYATDPTDTIGNEMLKRFNGEYLETSPNLNFKESREVTALEFGAPAFVMDGQDSLYDANVVNSMGAVLSSLQLEGVLKTQADTIGLAKILIHATASGNTDARTYSMPYSSYNSLPEFADDSGPFFPITLSDLKNYNPQMSFSPDADAVQQNLWEYWQIEVPSNSKKTNITFNFKLNYCCRYNSLDLYQSVLFENGDSGEINFIEFNFANREITVKGNLI
jgi:hypothetical protein